MVKKYGGKWVAMKPYTSSVVASGERAKEVYEEAQKKGYKIPTLFKVPVKLTPYIGWYAI